MQPEDAPTSPTLPFSSNSYAVVVIDMQQEFFTPAGMFKNKHLKSDPLTTNLSSLIPHFREHSPAAPIIWIRSVYPNLPSPPGAPPSDQKERLYSVLERTHNGKRKCCVEGSPLLDFLPEINGLIHPADRVLTKNWYSAFKETDLHAWLQERKIERLVVAGVTANTCIFATARTAIGLGYQVSLLKDCIGFNSEQHAEFALNELEQHGATIIHSDTLKAPCNK